MGTFEGHAMPGTFFIIVGLWYIYYLLKSYYRRRAYDLGLSQDHFPAYVSRYSAPIDCQLSRCCGDRGIPVDSFVKLSTCLLGVIFEASTEFNFGALNAASAQHVAMYSAFGLSGLVELLLHYRLLKLPRQVELVFGTMALLAEGFLFMFHLHDRTPVDVYVHLLLLGCLLLSIVAGVGEMVTPGHVGYSLLRAWGILAQGTWFWQVGAILYPVASWMPRWDQTAKQSFPRAANLFCYHLLATFVTIVVIAIVMCLRYARMDAKTAANRLEGVTRYFKDNEVTCSGPGSSNGTQVEQFE